MKAQAAIEGATPRMNRSAKDGARSSWHYGSEGVLTHPSNQGVFGRHGTEDLDVTPGPMPGIRICAPPHFNPYRIRSQNFRACPALIRSYVRVSVNFRQIGALEIGSALYGP